MKSVGSCPDQTGQDGQGESRRTVFDTWDMPDGALSVSGWF